MRHARVFSKNRIENQSGPGPSVPEEASGRRVHRDGGIRTPAHPPATTTPSTPKPEPKSPPGKDVLNCDVVVGLHPSEDHLRPGTILVCVADPFRHPQRVQDCCTNTITLLSLDVIPAGSPTPKAWM